VKADAHLLAQLIFSTLKMETIRSSETSVDTKQTTGLYIPEDCTLQDFSCSIALVDGTMLGYGEIIYSVQLTLDEILLPN
jgi:hypothetical protein